MQSEPEKISVADLLMSYYLLLRWFHGFRKAYVVWPKLV
jgi:hypothetical protein